MEYREERQKAYVMLDLDAMLPAYMPGGFNPQTVLIGWMKALIGADRDIALESIAVSVPSMDRPEPTNLVERCVEIYVSEGYGLEDIEQILRRAADKVKKGIDE